ncbi:MAG: hypothetical protein ACPL06_00430 [Candidatus Anstonellales archaeon]
MKGQATIEYLLITLIALTLLSFSLHALINANTAQQIGYQKALFLSDATDLAHAMSEVCVLGDGNSRKIQLKSEIEISGSGKMVTIRQGGGGNSTSSEELPCTISSSGTFSGAVYVKNEGGSIVVEE